MSKGTFWRKHILRMAAVLPVIAVLCMSGIHANAEKSNLSADVRKQEDRFYPSEEEAGRLAETLPILCTPVEATYQKNEDGPGFSEELLADLQEYVRRGELAEAIDAYRDETLLINVEELRLLCPDYESLLAEWMKEQQGIEIKAEDVTDKIRQIYALGQDDGEEPLLLLECSDFEIPWYYKRKRRGTKSVLSGWKAMEAWTGSVAKEPFLPLKMDTVCCLKEPRGADIRRRKNCFVSAVLPCRKKIPCIFR